jgi:uncharacterized protein (TIGR03000 family)
MLRNIFSFGGMLLLAGVAVIATPGSSWAQRGGHGGGGHIGGGRIGGGHIRGGHIGGGLGAYHSSAFHNGYHPSYYHGGYYPYRSNYGYYGGYYPYNGDYGYSGWNYDPGYYGSYGTMVPSSYTAPNYGGHSDAYDGDNATTADLSSSSGNNAVVHVRLPQELAEVAFDGHKTTTTGKNRVYSTPALTPGKTYTYTVTASWTEGDVPRSEMRTVQVHAGQSSTVDFTKKP